ncbi:cytochrome c assembly protein [Thermovibrio ammonificans HB-1]|uniref:Cytochrome c assembly protein n=1 Tax=Thermovibrio ammonificans (strain DSM 15698 / JCM 12110 / HB-1) TaxID=648996 RepID=E8T6Q8_THEA1|nr:cytochrome c biogenesis protein CcsA [Thermovibrio ammonificans]ADU96842.1 cytochrome c assembly protein [Thermovibrio ammonificans HB-1]
MEKLLAAVGLLGFLLAAVKREGLLLLIPAISLLAAIAAESLKLGYPPLFSGYYAIALFGALFALSGFSLKANPKFVGTVGAVVTAILLALNPQVKEIPPIVRTPLFFIHVGTAMVSYSVFAVAAIYAIWKGASKEEIEPLTVAKWGFWLFTLSLWVGAVWAFLAWGDLFPVDPKSLLSLGFWLYCGALLHLPFDSKLQRVKEIGVVGAGLYVLFLFLGVNFLLGGSHGF